MQLQVILSSSQTPTKNQCMNATAIFLLSVALAMDAFAVAVATGLRLGKPNGRQFFRLAFHFGLFQFLMPVIGWLLGLSVRDYMENWDHWVAFALLAWIGINMVRESFKSDEEKEERSDPTRKWSLIMLSVATSIDALAVGLSFSLLGVSVWGPALCIGVVCAVITLMGMKAGASLASAKVLGRWAEALGGTVLLGIGVKILLEHEALNMFWS